MTKESKEQWVALFLGAAGMMLILSLATKYIPGALGHDYHKIRQEAVDKGYAQWNVEGDGKTKWSWK